MAKNFEQVVARQELELRAILGQDEVVIEGQSLVADVEAASASEVLFAIDPDVESLVGLSAAQAHEHAFDDVTAAGGAVEQGAEVDLGTVAASRVEEGDRGRLGHFNGAGPE